VRRPRGCRLCVETGQDTVGNGNSKERGKSKRQTGNLQRLLNIPGTLGDESDLLEAEDTPSGEVTAPLGHPPEGEEVGPGLSLAEVTGKGVPPVDDAVDRGRGEREVSTVQRKGREAKMNALATVGKVLLVNDLETDSLERITSHSDRPHLRDTVSELDTVLNLLVAGVGLVKVVGHAPFVDTESSSGLEDLEDLAVHSLPVRGVAGCLDSAARRGGERERKGERRKRHVVSGGRTEGTRSENALDGIERVGAELLSESHEVALDERNLVGETGLRGVLAGAEDLELVVVKTDNCRCIELASSSTRNEE
jgi:hypothetical protein